jgi:hypothetical protein
MAVLPFNGSYKSSLKRFGGKAPFIYSQAWDPLWQKAGVLPSLDLDFTRETTVDRMRGITLTFTRASTALYWDGSQFVEAAVNEPRFAVDPATGLGGLLVEEARTNLLLNSATLSTQSVTVAATAHTLSFFGTGTVTLSGASTAGPLVGTGAGNRVSLTFTPTAGSLTLTVSGSVTTAQLEAGLPATSPIITTGSAVTRAADRASILPADMSGVYNGTSLSMYAEWINPVALAGTFRRILAFTGTVSDSESFTLQRPISNETRFEVLDNGVQQCQLTNFSAIYPVGSIVKQAGAAAANNFAFCDTAGNVLTDNTATMPIPDRIEIGSDFAGLAPFSGIIRRVNLWDFRLSNTALQAITAP